MPLEKKVFGWSRSDHHLHHFFVRKIDFTLRKTSLSRKNHQRSSSRKRRDLDYMGVPAPQKPLFRRFQWCWLLYMGVHYRATTFFSTTDLFDVWCEFLVSVDQHFTFFGPLKDALRGNLFATDEKMITNKLLRDQQKIFFFNGISKLDRWKKCIGKQGDYVEK